MLGEQTGKWEGAPGLLQVDRAQKPAVCLLEEGWELLAGARECRGKLSAHNIKVSLVRLPRNRTINRRKSASVIRGYNISYCAACRLGNEFQVRVGFGDTVVFGPCLL